MSVDIQPFPRKNIERLSHKFTTDILKTLLSLLTLKIAYVYLSQEQNK